MVRFILGLVILLAYPQTGWGWRQTSDESILTDFVRLFMQGKNKGIGLPVDPRTIINLEDRISTPTKVTVGIQTDILGVVQGDFKTEVDYTREYSVSTLIIVEGENADIIRQSPSGSYFLDSGNRKAVRVCAISASLNLSHSFVGKVFVATGGIQRSKVYSGTEEIRQTSNVALVNPGESLEFHKKACAEFADRKYAQVMTSLKGLAASRIYWDDLSQCNPTEPITRDSVCGKWHTTLLPSVEAWTTPACERRPGQRSFFCTLRSIKGGACSYRDAETKRLVTSGMFEYPCGAGLECKLIKPGGWFNYGTAECRPVNAGAAATLRPNSANLSHR